MDYIPVGSEGECTADLEEDNVFAVMFDSIIKNGVNWARFNYDMKSKYFELVE
jgi:hypothetical protein